MHIIQKHYYIVIYMFNFVQHKAIVMKHTSESNLQQIDLK